MSDERAGPIDLALIGRALQWLTTDVAAMRDEMRVQTAMILHEDAARVRMRPSTPCSNSCG
jgi:hypothetical protein